MSGKMLPDNWTKRRKNIHRMPERCRIFVPVSKGNRGNNNKKTSLKKQVAEILNLIFFKIRYLAHPAIIRTIPDTLLMPIAK
jgi:hypothetical protein